MSSRFHQKHHRFNHHSKSNPTPMYPDSGFDPIASFDSPFQGEFFSNGDIITTETLSSGKDVYVGRSLIVENNFILNQDLIVGDSLEVGNKLRVLGTATNLNRTIMLSSAIIQVGNNATALYVDSETTTVPGVNIIHNGVPVFVVQAPFGYIGIRTENPNEELTVFGSITASENIFSNGAYVSGNVEISDNLRVNNNLLTVTANTNKIGINTSIPETTLHITGTDGLVLPVGNNQQRYSLTGTIRYNIDANSFEGYTGSAWVKFGSQQGLTSTKVFRDLNNILHTVVIENGIITSWTQS